MKNKILPLVIFLSLIFFACKTSKSSNHTTSNNVSSADTVWVVKYDRSACFGNCPVYTFYLTETNNGLIEAKYNFIEPGWYHADLDEESVHALMGELEPEDWWREDLRNQPEIADLPGRSIVYKHKDGLRWFAMGGRTSEQAEYVCNLFDELIGGAKWMPTDIRPTNPDIPQPTDVLVQLKADVEINRWMMKFENFGIRLVKKVAPNLSYYVVSWNVDKGTANDFLQSIKLDREVVDAQWDQALNGRSKKSETISK